MDQRILFLIGLTVVASGCISQASEDLGDVSENPENFEGEEIVLQGEVRDTSGMEEALPSDDDRVPEEVRNVHSSNKVIGNLDGQIDFAGCEPSEIASEVEVRGTVESYERCDCEPRDTERALEDGREQLDNMSDNINSIEVGSSVEFADHHEYEVWWEENTFKQACDQGTTETKTLFAEETALNPGVDVEYQGCAEDTVETHYYFSCQEIVEEYE